jgi:hypothetical protein
MPHNKTVPLRGLAFNRTNEVYIIRWKAWREDGAQMWRTCCLHHHGKAASTFETSVNSYQTTRRNIPEDSHLQTCFGLDYSIYKYGTTVQQANTGRASEPVWINSKPTEHDNRETGTGPKKKGTRRRNINLIVYQLVRKFPAFYETQILIIMFIRSRHENLIYARWIQSTTSHPI